MTIYPLEFHRRLEQKWARRIDQILIVTGNATPPRDPNDNDDDEDEEDEDRTDEPASPFPGLGAQARRGWRKRPDPTLQCPQPA